MTLKAPASRRGFSLPPRITSQELEHHRLVLLPYAMSPTLPGPQRGRVNAELPSERRLGKPLIKPPALEVLPKSPWILRIPRWLGDLAHQAQFATSENTRWGVAERGASESGAPVGSPATWFEPGSLVGRGGGRGSRNQGLIPAISAA